MRRRLVLPVVLAAALASSGCGMLRTLGDPGLDGFGRQDEALRRLLMTGATPAALQQVAPEERAAPRDELLRLLYEGAVARYAGEYEASSFALDRAAQIAEDRYTRSVSRAALSVLTSDLALVYQPAAAERLLVHYYAALNHLDAGDPQGAAVEARRLSTLLARYDDAGESREGLAGSPLLRHFAGAVFEAAGETEDAQVSYRQATVLAGDSAFVRRGPLPDSVGEVVVLVERGFVAHRVEQSLNVMIAPHEMHVLGTGEGEARAATAAEIAARVTAHALREATYYETDRPRALFVDAPPRPATPEPRCEAAARQASAGTRQDDAGTASSTSVRLHVLLGDSAAASTQRTAAAPARCDDVDDENPYLLRVAWPVFLARPRVPPAAEVELPEGAAPPFRLGANVSRAVVRDFEEDRKLILARTVARAAAKLALTKKVESEVGEKNEGLGRVLGFIANASTAVLERADTRSWHLLPADIDLVRIALPAGEHRLSLRVGTDRTVELPPVRVVPGGVAVVSTRVWQ